MTELVDLKEPFNFYEVGGCVRDELMGVNSKDVDYSVVPKPGIYKDGYSAYVGLQSYLTERGFQVFQAKATFLTIKAKVPLSSELSKRSRVADFVVSRRDGKYVDGRRPESTELGSLADDLARRDFTVNALAKATDGSLIDLFGGEKDIKDRVLRFVGDPAYKVKQDGVRVLRAIRFKITKNLKFHVDTENVIYSELAAEMLAVTELDRIRTELQKMFFYDSLQSINLLGSKTKCEPTDDQLSGVGFSTTIRNKLSILVDKRPYEVVFGSEEPG
jgi:tRNA nucleotidyltransferase/poly(A) polymerase